MKLYDNDSAPNPRRVQMVIAEKGIDIPRIPVDISSFANRQADFLAINPLGFVPVLELDNGTYLSESLAICRYLDQLYPEPKLFGDDIDEQAIIDMWNLRVEYELFRRIMFCFQNTHPFFANRIQQVADFGEVSRDVAINMLNLLNKELSNRNYIAGNKLSIADISALCAIDFARVIKLRISEEQQHLQDWYNRMQTHACSKI